MKKRLLAALLSGCIVLSGCASMLERDYVSATPHTSTTTDEGNSSVLRAENYQELVNSLIYFISTGSEDGVVRLYMDAGLVDESLRTARLEVLQEDPLAAYAVENITFSFDPLMAYTEATADITYRRTQQQMSSIVTANGIYAVRNELSSALARFAPECVLRINYFEQSEDYVRDLIQQAYYTTPATALEYPQAEVHIYPETGRQHIVEVLFQYETDTALLAERSALLVQSVRRLCGAMTLSGTPLKDLTAAAQTVLSQGGLDQGGGSTPYDALLGGGADSEGLALAMALVCEELGLSCRVARGLLEGETHCWNVVSTGDGWRHMDLSRQSTQNGFFTDEEWGAQGYLWIETLLPACK